jgi:hypothetical protein
MTWPGGAESFATPIFDQMLAASAAAPEREVVLIFADGSRAAWSVHDPHSLPFLLIAESLRQSSPSPIWPKTTE